MGRNGRVFKSSAEISYNIVLIEPLLDLVLSVDVKTADFGKQTVPNFFREGLMLAIKIAPGEMK